MNDRDPSLWKVYMKAFPHEILRTLLSKLIPDVVIYVLPLTLDAMTSYAEKLERGEVSEVRVTFYCLFGVVHLRLHKLGLLNVRMRRNIWKHRRGRCKTGLDTRNIGHRYDQWRHQGRGRGALGAENVLSPKLPPPQHFPKLQFVYVCMCLY